MENLKTELKSMFTEHWKYLAINAACKLELFDKINESQNTLKKLINNNNWHADSLTHLVQFLIKFEYLIENEDNSYLLSEKGDLLRKNNPDGLFYACLNWSDEHLTAWQNLDYSIKTGKSSFENIYKKPFFDYLNENPKKLHAYHKAMYQYAKDDYKELINKVDFSIHNSVLDIGGGYGAILETIKKQNPNIDCILFDLDKVLRNISLPTIKKVSGDFFDKIPIQSDAIILSRIIHDWNDEKANLILKNCYDALTKGGTLYLVENCKDMTDIDLSLLSLNMTAMCKSYERTSKQYIQLCKQNHFIYQQSISLNQLQTILILKK